MFSRGDMGGLAEKTLREYSRQRKWPVEVVRVTVPGMKDLPVACKRLLEEKNCAIALAFAFVGGEDIDETCAFEAGIGLQFAQLLSNKHILGVFVYTREAMGRGGEVDAKKLAAIMRDRVTKHAKNALEMIFDPDSLKKRAGTGQRQGGKNAGGWKL